MGADAETESISNLLVVLMAASSKACAIGDEKLNPGIWFDEMYFPLRGLLRTARQLWIGTLASR
jgi:hypothetical protein